MIVPVWGALALGYQIASRLAYVLYVGFALKSQDRSGHFTRRYGADEGFRRFRRTASTLMANDGVSFVAVCLLTWNTLPPEIPRGLAVAAGTLLVLVGVSTKLWAAATLGGRAYYWYNFFTSTGTVAPNSAGPYRFLKNPMYTVGYLHTYGLALVTASLPGLLAALFDQGAILAFYRWVEKPHFEKYSEGAATSHRSRMRSGEDSLPPV